MLLKSRMFTTAMIGLLAMAACAAGNVAPTVEIDWPMDGYVYGVSDEVILEATADAGGGTVIEVKFFDGTTSLGDGWFDSDSGAWWGFWTDAKTLGPHTLTAVATSSAGLSTTSAPITIVVDAPPTVQIVSPASGLVGSRDWAISVTATAGDSDGIVLQVEFFDAATSLGVAAFDGDYWVLSWSATKTLGPHTLTAVAIDDDGVTTTSAPITVMLRLAADGNGDGAVDGEDYGIWQNGYLGSNSTFLTGDYNGDGVVDGEDYGVWQNSYGHTSGTSDSVAASSAAATSNVAAGATPRAGSTAPRLIATTPASGEAAADITSVRLIFDRDVVVSAGAVEVDGLVSGPQAYASAYDAGTRTLTLIFAAALPADAYTVRIIGSFVVAADGGAALDGAASGTPGSDARLEFSITAG